MPRSRLQAAAAALIVASGILISAPAGNRDALPRSADSAGTPLQPAALSITLRRGQLLIEGAGVSRDHETALVQLGADQFPQRETQVRLTPAVLLPGNWDTASSRLLYALAAASSARADMDASSIRIRAVTAKPELFAARLEFLAAAIDPHMTLVHEIIDIAVETPFEDLCRRAFGSLHLEPVSFHQSSSEIRSSSVATLDRLIQFAHDCPGASIRISGHTDATGDANWNRYLSRERAQAVADHMAGKGIPAQRLRVEGRGAAEPIAGNETAHGRELNRRIEFELL